MWVRPTNKNVKNDDLNNKKDQKIKFFRMKNCYQTGACLNKNVVCLKNFQALQLINPISVPITMPV